jgi:hypothetical protein
MKNFRFLLVLAVLLCLVAPVFAQEFDMNFGLSDDDAALFGAANENTSDFSSISFEFTLELSAMGAIEGQLTGSGGIDSENEAFSLAVEGELTSEGETIPAALDVAVVDEVVYFNAGGMGWYSLTEEDMEGLMDMGSAMGGLPFDPGALASGDMSDMEGMGEMMGALATLNPNDLLSIERGDDEDGLAHFTATLDIAPLLENEAFMEMIAEQSGGEMSASDLEAAQAMFANAVLTFEQYIDEATQMVTRAVLTIDLQGMFTLVFDIELSGFNEPVTVEAPEDAAPFEELMQMLMGGMGAIPGT